MKKIFAFLIAISAFVAADAQMRYESRVTVPGTTRRATIERRNVVVVRTGPAYYPRTYRDRRLWNERRRRAEWRRYHRRYYHHHWY